MRFPGATHLVIGFQHRAVAERFLEQMRERMQAFGLELHSQKTRLIEFGRFAIERRRRNGAGKPETFNFLGFTHICGSIHKTGRFTVMRKTIGKRMAAKLKGIEAELRKRMHEPIRGTGEWLRAVVRGYYIYHAVPGNFSRLRSFRHDVKHSWWQAVRRRGQRVLRREVFDRIVAQYLPTPVILHPYPLERFSVKHPRQEPCALTLTSARTGPCGGCRATGIPTAISGELSVSRIKNAETDGY